MRIQIIIPFSLLLISTVSFATEPPPEPPVKNVNPVETNTDEVPPKSDETPNTDEDDTAKTEETGTHPTEDNVAKPTPTKEIVNETVKESDSLNDEVSPESTSPKSEELAPPKAADSSKDKRVHTAEKVVAAKALMLYNGDLSVALTRAVSATKFDEERFKPVTIRDISGGKPILEGPGDLQVCRGKTADNRSIRTIKKKVLKNIGYVNYEEADELLQKATDYLNCLTEPLIGLDAAEVFFMKGFLDYEVGRQGLSQDSFRRALIYDEEMEWDDNFPPNAIDLFEAAQSDHDRSEASVTIRLLPIPAEGTAWLDGQSISSPDGVINVSAGTHLLQFSVPQVYTVSLYVKDNSKLTLMLPALVPNEAVAWVNDPDERTKLKLLLGAMLDSNEEVYVSNGGEVWQYSPSRDAWAELAVPNGFFAANPEEMGKYYSTQALFWSGAIAVGTGGTFGLISSNKARQAQTVFGNSTSYLEREEARTRHQIARANTAAGLGIFLTGAVLAGTSFVVQADGKLKVAPHWGREGGGLSLNLPLR